jgi:hypothetical protein
MVVRAHTFTEMAKLFKQGPSKPSMRWVKQAVFADENFILNCDSIA